MLSTALMPLFAAAVFGQVATVTPTSGARFLEQATWGPTSSDLARVQSLGIERYLNSQFSTPISQFPYTFPADPANNGSIAQLQQNFMAYAVNNPDQLRQRVAFALSQIWVVSNAKIGNGQAMTTYYQLLMKDAFANYYKIMYDVTLNPAMGHYLDMVNNDKANPAANTEPNQNYARELMQLFTIGLSYLNDDGSLKTNGTGQPIATYDQNVIAQMANVLTGWTYADPGVTITHGHNPAEWTDPMIAVEINHDQTAKTLFSPLPGGTPITIPAGTTAAQDLQTVLQALFNHPNLPPFVCTRLIQHLTTSNPSPAYIQRVVDVFKSNAIGTRGDMKSVIAAILTDPEARAGDTVSNGNPAFGHLKEPALFVSGILRGLNATVPATNSLANATNGMGQNLFYQGSVFNYFAPEYQVSPGVLGPEFQIDSQATALARANTVYGLIYSGSLNSATFDITPWQTLAANSTQLIQAINTAFFRSQMSSTLDQAILAAYNAVPAGSNQAKQRAQAALYIALTSQEYWVQH